MKHPHPLDHETVRQCTLEFGQCWSNPPFKKEAKDYSNRPHGVIKPDMDARSYL